MTFGFNFTNSSGGLLIADSAVTPMLYSVNVMPAATNPAGVLQFGSGRYKYSHVLNLTTAVDTQLIHFVFLPDVGASTASTPVVNITQGGTGTTRSVYMAVYSTLQNATYTIPTVYSFSLAGHQAPAGGAGNFCVQVFKPTGELCFDSRLLPLALQGILTGGTWTSVYPGPFPAKAAFLIPVYEGYTIQNTGTEFDYEGTMSMNAGSLNLHKTNIYKENNTGLSQRTEDYGASSNLVVPYIDGAMYD